jgi:FixJ family two-component response regulator
MDLSMPEMGGLEVQTLLASSGHTGPIIFITGHGDIPSSVKAMKAGAIDFLTKPFDDEALLSAIRTALAKDQTARQAKTERDQIEKSLSDLTIREREVFEHVTRGRLNKQIAGDLGIVEKTVKVQRGRVMKKMGVRTLAELVRLAGRLGLSDPKR